MKTYPRPHVSTRTNDGRPNRWYVNNYIDPQILFRATSSPLFGWAVRRRVPPCFELNRLPDRDGDGCSMKNDLHCLTEFLLDFKRRPLHLTWSLDNLNDIRHFSLPLETSTERYSSDTLDANMYKRFVWRLKNSWVEKSKYCSNMYFPSQTSNFFFS